MPKKFNRTLWVKRDGFLLIERAEGIAASASSAALNEQTGEGQQGEAQTKSVEQPSSRERGEESNGSPSASAQIASTAAAAAENGVSCRSDKKEKGQGSAGIAGATNSVTAGGAAIKSSQPAASKSGQPDLIKSSQSQPKVTGTIVAVLYDEQVRVCVCCSKGKILHCMLCCAVR